jgi:NAD(P)-dependent dehydrogenase (short-subunit alcohol dehydrogenase family)
MTANTRTRVLITGAAGGMGRACTRLFGMTHDLVLNDVAGSALESFAAELERDGYTVVGSAAGDLCDEAVLSSLIGFLSRGQPFIVVHTAGVSPSQTDWKTIMRVNLLGTAKLVQAAEPLLVAGSVAILIASTAGHVVPPLPDAESVLAAPLEPDLIDRIAPFVEAMAAHAGPAGACGVSYSLSKKAVLQLCERKVIDWGRRGGRIVTISPGLILTPMGRQELEKTPGAAEVLNATPVGRAGTAADIAMTARFLASSEAAFITGSDVRVDGGSVSAMRQKTTT